MVVLPAPVEPTKAIFWPGVANRLMLCRTIFSGWVRSGVSVSTSAIRSALAVLMVIMTNTMDSIIRLMRTLMT